MRTKLTSFGLGLLAIFLMLPGLTSVCMAQSSAAERSIFQAVNRERHASGLAPLRWDDSLASAARQHAGVMASQRAVAHSFAGEPSLPGRASQAGVHYSWLSENVVEASDASAAHTQFMNSPTHRANILDSDMDIVGIGVVARGSSLYVVEDFAKAK